MAADTYPLPKPVRAIGVPYQGTHAKAFNRKGGSDNWESENAVDLPVPKGTPVYAVAAGTVGRQIGSLGTGGRFAGLRLHLVTANNEFYYAHLSKLVVKAGQAVKAGDLLGYSGVANGVAHLHLAAKHGDPRDAFGATLPTPAASTAPDVSAGQPLAVTPPTPVAPPTAVGVPGPMVQTPGSVDYTLSPHDQAVGLWSQVAQGDLVSPDTQQLLSNAQMVAGGAGASG